MDRLTKQINGEACHYDCNGPCGTCDGCTCFEIGQMVDRLSAYEDICYSEDGTEHISIDRLRVLAEADRDGRCVVLPCKVGDTVWVVERCENVKMSRDDDYETGTGTVECPFEASCDIEDCDDDHVRIFETTVEDFWYGEQNACHPEVFLADMGHGYMRDDFGKTVFLTREEAEAALKGEEEKHD